MIYVAFLLFALCNTLPHIANRLRQEGEYDSERNRTPRAVSDPSTRVPEYPSDP